MHVRHIRNNNFCVHWTCKKIMSCKADLETFFFLESNWKKAKKKIPVITPTSHVITNRNTIGAQ